MLEKEIVYRKDHKENIKLFSDLKANYKYSMYATELNRVFGERTYDQFYKGLLENKKMHINNFQKMFEKPVVKGGITKKEEPFDIKIFASCLKKMNIKAKELEYKIKHPHVLNESQYKYTKEVEKKLKTIENRFRLPDIPDIGRYNPNYDSVRTHSYYPIFASTDFENFNKNRKNIYAHQILSVKEPKSDRLANHINSKKSINNNEKLNTEPNNLNSERLNRSVKTSDFNLSQLMSTSSFGNEKNNHCLRFDSYSPRKSIINKVNYDSAVVNNSTNYRLFRNIKGNVDFNKSSNSNFGSYFDEIAKNNNNPPLGMYEPNYDFISRKTINIFLNKRDPPSPKLSQLKKIIFDYNISKEYKIVTGLNNKISKIDINKTK